MAFDYQAYLKSLKRFGEKPGLARIRRVLTHLADPHLAYPVVHVGGTNGKGSVVAMTASVLAAAGYRTGMFTKPHLVRYNERIRVNGEEIPDDALAALFEETAAAVERAKAELGADDPTEFEVGTAVMFLHFARVKVDVAVVEVGLGGRLDSTNVVEPRVVALGPTALDHTAVLGPDLASIAREKAGIFKRGVPAVLAPQPPEALAEYRKAAESAGCPLALVRRREAWDPGARPRGEVWYREVEWGPGGGRLDVATERREYRDLEISLLGRHQLQNVAVAVGVLDLLGDLVPEEALRRGLKEARWPGRLELVPGKPRLIFDGVHNPGGAEAFAASFGALFPGERPVFVIAALGEKDAEGMLKPLQPFIKEAIFTKPSSSRLPPASPEALAEKACSLGIPSTAVTPASLALEEACRRAGPEGMVCALGSLYLVGELKAALQTGWDPRTFRSLA